MKLTITSCRCWPTLALCFLAVMAASALDIQLPPETGAFKQDPGADIANGQCLICHSVEYVTTQPVMPRTFWKAEVQKMQQKYGAPIVDAQVDTVVDYLTKNYGAWTNGTATASQPTTQQVNNQGGSGNAVQLATKYGCLGCHNPQTKLVGPAYKDIAAKYKNDPEALAKIDQQIHKGGSGKWGPIIMPPFAALTPAETKTLADWILSLK
ncbi:MAG TPA: c-type cytochrome [Candidatus Dormibacteraeota bacterium]|nr:c-type cytochrome [Candidatus Dormibacteraeota bacterium]